MKVAFLFDVKLDKYKGSYYAINLNKNLWDKYYLPYFDEIKLICRSIDVTQDPSEKMHRVNMENVKVYSFENKSILSRILNIKEENKQIEEWIKDCDVVISRSFWGIAQARKMNKPYMIEVVSCMWDSLWNHSIKGKILALPMSLLMKKAVKDSLFVLYVTEEFLQKRYPCKGKTVGVSDVIITPMTELEKEKRFQKIKNINLQNKIKLGTAAAVNVKYKGQRFVIEALALLKKEGITNIEYHLAGGGDQTNLKEIAKKMDVFDQVVFHGSLKHEKVIDFLDDIDIYIQPSLQEGLPRAVVEAMSRGCPCIGANTGGIPELLMSSTICSRKNMAKDIVKKLEFVLNKENMLTLSKYSLEKSNDYRKEVLDNKRIKFMKQFIEYVNKKNNLHI